MYSKYFLLHSTKGKTSGLKLAKCILCIKLVNQSFLSRKARRKHQGEMLAEKTSNSLDEIVS